MVVLDSKIGHIKDSLSRDEVILVTYYPYSYEGLEQELEINLHLQGERKVIKKKLPYGGYDMHLFLGDFLGEGRDCILVKGRFQGSGDIAILLLYEYSMGEMNLVLDQWDIVSKERPKIRYVKGYKVEIVYGEKEKYFIDLKEKEEDYLNLIYDERGEVKLKTGPGISDINTYYEVKALKENYYTFLIRQNIKGVVLSDILGIIQSRVEFKGKREVLLRERELIIK